MSQGADWLKVLASPHASAAGLARGGGAPADGTFEAMLERAREGALATGIPVRVPEHLGLSLSEEQRARLSVAADRADARGAGRVLVSIDGMLLTMDVGTRTITGRVDPRGAVVLDDVDALVTAGDARDSGEPAPLARLGPPGVNPAWRASIDGEDRPAA